MRTLEINCKFGIAVLVAGLVGTTVIHWLPLPNLKPEDMRQIASTSAQVAATMMGFLLAALAILASIANMRLLRNMQRSGMYQVLLGRMLIAAAYFFVALVFSMLVLVDPDIVKWPLQIGGGILLASCFALVDATWKFAMVLFQLKPEQNTLE